MSRNLPRLYVEASLQAGGCLSLSPDHAHYLRDVMRLSEGDPLLVFNGRDGEWRYILSQLDRKRAEAIGGEQTRAQTPHAQTPRAQTPHAGPDLYFAPVKKTGTAFIAEKATELGVGSLRPVITAYTDTKRINTRRLHAHGVEAAEQCGRLEVPTVHAPVALPELALTWSSPQALIVADNTGAMSDIVSGVMAGVGSGVLDVLKSIDRAATPPAFLIGPQGGFSETELVFLRGLPFVTCVDLGPRILRAETAAVSILTCWQAVHGDWT